MTRTTAAHAVHSDSRVTALLQWYAGNARDLPWRSPDADPWGVLVSEVMLQQTPVSRVLPVWLDWMQRWPTASALAADSVGEALRRWDRLGYPRRALRLHECAGVLVDRHQGRVPAELAELIALPGIGEYTAAAVASFAFGKRHPVVDTNIRRVQARWVTGRQYPARSLSAAERALARALLPPDPKDGEPFSPRWNVAVMELGALVCTARDPDCAACPVSRECAWLQAGRPVDQSVSRRGQAWQGTDRQVRGRMMARLRGTSGALSREELFAGAGCEPVQAERALAGLLGDGLVTYHEPDRYTLPGETP